ncbi:MAG: EMC3/TMCO1 family protein [Candidatus Thermoplasmatota archaeon]|nr:EMC3/TMCO1 family protein [Candidatus Thermoplasmatota archaeon]
MVFFPLLGFGYRFPVLTIFLAGSVVIIISALVRHFTTDWIEMAKNQEILSKFQKEYKEARLSNNKYMIKKLEKMQPKLMQKQGEMSSKQMKIMPITLIIFIPIFTWIWDFLTGTTHYYFDVPWAIHVNCLDKYLIFPNWILLYMLLSIPLTQVIQYLLKVLSWSEWRAKVNEG